VKDYTETYGHLAALSPKDGLQAVESTIEQVRATHKAEMVYLQKLAQSYRAKVRWERESGLASIPPDPETGERIIDPEALSNQAFNKILRSMQER